MSDFEKLEWIPLYIDRLLSSQRWRLMRDFEKGWYLSLLVESVRSERPGYLKVDENLWRLAGAQSRPFFEKNNERVLACFERREIEGHEWAFQERLVQTLGEQHLKIIKRRKTKSPLISPTLSSESVGSSMGKPSVKEIQEYCAERNNGIDAELFRDFYQAKGWKIGKNPMRDWKAAIRTWEKNEAAQAGKNYSEATVGMWRPS